MKRKMNPIVIEPITFSWSREWIPLERALSECLHTVTKQCGPIACATLVGAHQRVIDIWLKDLSEKQQRDVVSLLFAECDMLWEQMDPGKAPFEREIGGPEWSDFRERWFRSIQLAMAVERCEFNRGAAVLRAWREMGDRAHEKQFLP